MFQLAGDTNLALHQKMRDYCHGCPHLHAGVCSQLNRLLDSFLSPQQPMPCFRPLNELAETVSRPARQRARRSSKR